MNIFTISVVVSSPTETESPLISHFLKNLKYLIDKIEIILAIGKQPSVQRNKATGVARGDIVYFLMKTRRYHPIFLIRSQIYLTKIKK